MFDTAREKLLLTAVIALTALLLAYLLLVRPVGRYVGDLDADIAALRGSIADAREVLAHPAPPRLDFSGLRPATEQDQNEFRKYLESLARPGQVRNSSQQSVRDLDEKSRLKLITYELKLSGTAEEHRLFLERLDQTPEPLRIENVTISGTEGSEDPALEMRLIVSTIARTPDEPA